MMAKLEKNDKLKLSKKLLKIQKKGLVSFREYLEKEYFNAADDKTKKKYCRYIEDQIVDTDKKLRKMDKKIGEI
ncbi:hypothetical protein DNU06_02910 [Putridiphycobacter roseus]|uniref:Uncharacterized protein n=1 Tax=Putridiphycobacter roseus TaxID=2219161 RepID=A0A2W1NLS4_9FLAO|nr:hypothetical protein [Putridiphycobacter roseus]PZE18796.1 hypothetical protein DNU06_02910 [Putridiphycobacter roseus]